MDASYLQGKDQNQRKGKKATKVIQFRAKDCHFRAMAHKVVQAYYIEMDC